MRMKPLILIVASAIAIPAFAIQVTPRSGDRIGVLRISERFDYGGTSGRRFVQRHGPPAAGCEPVTG